MCSVMHDAAAEGTRKNFMTAQDESTSREI